MGFVVRMSDLGSDEPEWGGAMAFLKSGNPVFVFESLVQARRALVSATRAPFVLVLLIGLACGWITTAETCTPGMPARQATLRMLAKVGEQFFYALTGIQLTLVLLAAPAAAAGAICYDRARGP